MVVPFQYPRLAAVGITAGTLVLFVWRFPHLPDLGGSHLDKAVHALLFFAVAFCYINTATAGFRSPQVGRFFLGFVAALAYGFFVEVLQHFIPWRSFEWLDLLADASGAALALVFCLHLQKRFEVSPSYR